MESVKVTYNLIQKRKWIKYILNMKPWLFITLLVSFSFVVWVYYFFWADCLFVWLGCGTCIPFPILFSVQSQQRQNIFCTHKSLICKTLICKTNISPSQNLHMYATCARSSYAKLSICHSLWFDYRIPLYLCVP